MPIELVVTEKAMNLEDRWMDVHSSMPAIKWKVASIAVTARFENVGAGAKGEARISLMRGGVARASSLLSESMNQT